MKIVAVEKERRNKFIVVLANVSWYSWVCGTAVYQGASLTDVTLT